MIFVVYNESKKSNSMFINLQSVILASASPRRKAYFSKAGIQFSVVAAEIDETRREGESLSDYLQRMAYEKALPAVSRFPECWVVSADTIVSFGNELCDKPKSVEQAVWQLMQLSGRTHEVRTGFMIWQLSSNKKIFQTVMTEVTFWPFPESVAEAYVARGESFDKAGGYGIQGDGAILVDCIKGSYSNVVGLPMCQVLQGLLDFEVIAASAEVS